MKLINKWQDDIQKISDDVTVLVENRYIYNQVVGFTKRNSSINRSNVFWDFFKNNYVASQVLGVCNQVDADEKSQSLRNLLSEIFNDPDSITKDWYSKKYGEERTGEDKRYMIGIGKSEFKKYFGEGENIDPSLVYADIGKLLHVTKNIKRLRNKRIAHRDRNTVKVDVTFDELNTAIDVIEKITIKYLLLFKQAGFSTLVPAIQYNWQNIFTVPWIKSSS